MDRIQSLVLGIVQGATEFLPISSTAHLVLVPRIFGWEDPGLAFDVALHLGTLFAVIWYFWRDICAMGRAFFESLRNPRLREDPQQRLAWFIAVACIPGAIAGVLFEKEADSAFRDPLLIGAAMVLFALVLAASEYLGKRVITEEELSLKQALWVGLAQSLAIIPGASRSGVTIAAGLFVGLTREAAARFSFLLGSPIVLGAVVYKAKDLLVTDPILWEGIALGILSSTITGYLCIHFLIAFLRQRTTGVFIGYRIVVGSLIVAMALTGRLPRPADHAGPVASRSHIGPIGPPATSNGVMRTTL